MGQALPGGSRLQRQGAFTRIGLRSSKRPVLQPLTQGIPGQVGDDGWG